MICFYRLAVAAGAIGLYALPAFPQTNFTYQQFPSPDRYVAYVTAPNAHSADFNEDGLADVLTPAVNYTCVNGTCKPEYGLFLYLSNGSGNLKAPERLPIALVGLPSVAISDFNGDGHLDIAALASTGTVSLLYGRGDGTFAAPVAIQLPSGNYDSMVEADFDINNTQDLAALNSDGSLVLMFNDGKGNFRQRTATLDTPPSGFATGNLTVGDFNADGRPDVAWVEQGDPASQGTTVWSALNTANGVFSTKNQVNSLPVGFGNILAADLDLDGKTDLITWATQLSENCCSQYPITVSYSVGNGTFTSSKLATTFTTDIGVTDANGDGTPDVVTTSFSGVSVYLGNGNRTFTSEGTYNMSGGPGLMGLGFYDTSNRMGLSATSNPQTNYNGNQYLYAMSNDNAQGRCVYPSGAGIEFCSTVQVGGGVRVRGTARAQLEPVRHIEIWAAGKKVYQVFSDEFDATLNLPAGTEITAVEVEANGATRTATTVAPGGGCAAPGAPGVQVCSPTAGETMASPVTVIAAATGASGSVNHLELWVDGKKLGNYSGSTMDATVSLASGSHTATVVEVDSKYAYVKSAPVSFSVK